MNLFNELKRRNVFRIAGIYAVVGWILMQVAGTLEASLNLPAWFDSVITAGLLIGFPIALLLAWAFEMTPEGVKPTEALEGDSNIASSSKKMDSVIIVGIVLILALGLWQQMTKPVFTQAKATETKVTETKTVPSTKINKPIKKVNEVKILDASIAVLPFSDLSPAGDQEYFSDGISEEILNVLVQVDALKVASRTSSFGFKGQEALGLPTIAKRLNVRHILEGSVRKAGDMIRITAQLIDAQTDQHLWSQTFDRNLTTKNIFIIQDEISKAIVKKLGLVLDDSDDDSSQDIRIVTKNLDAYELYLEGNGLFENRNVVNIKLAIRKLEKAVELDPKFSQAWSKLAASYGVAPSWFDSDIDYKQLSNQAIAEAIKLSPELSLPYGIRGGNFSSMMPAQYKNAIADYNRALILDPNNGDVYLWRAEAYVNLGFFDKAEKDLLHCIELDPERNICKPWLGKVYLHQGKDKLAVEIYEEAISAGSYDMLDNLIFHYASQGNNKVVRWALALDALAFSASQLGTDVRYRALTDASFSFEKDVNEFEIKYRAILGVERFDNIDNYYFKRYQDMKGDVYLTAWWDQYDQDFLRSSHRKRLIRETGIYQYWREVEFPPQCRPVSDDDFECD